MQKHSGIRDNHQRGKVADYLRERISEGSGLSVVSAYFTIYAYAALSRNLDNIESLRFLFGEPRFIQSLDPEKTNTKAFRIEDEGLELSNRLQQKEVAKRCAEWIRERVDIRSIRESNLLHGKLYHIDDGNRSSFGAPEFNQILTNFAPRAKQRSKMANMPQDGEIDILIATDCISEGQNLQDCDLLVNYDIHWNPVRIIQRFGRVDRIGSPNAQIQLVNFWPTPDLNKYINLKNRVEARMALVDIAATNEDNILSNSELEELIQQDLKYRDKQLMRLKDEVLDLEDFNESVALNEFTLDDFRMDLSNYVEGNRAQLQDAPFGLYAVVPASSEQGSHFAAKRFGDKRKRKARILKLRNELAQLLKAETMLAPGDAERMTAWDPFDQNIHANFFDPEWMYGFQQGFDIVIGNPPYVRQEAIKEQKAELKPHYPHSYSGTADLYVYFYERSFQLLKPGGALSFITSNKWFRARYGQDLRQYMATHTELRQIIDFGDEDVFDALAYPTIVIATLRDKPVTPDKTSNTIRVLNWRGENDDHQVIDFPAVFEREGFAVPQSALKVGGWQLEPPTQRLLLERLRKSGKPLGDYCGGRFYYGIKTGLNDAFVISREQRDALIAEDPKAADIIKPFLRGRDVKRWNVESQDLWLIFTRRGIDIDCYPTIKTHLKAFRKQLEPKPHGWDDKTQGAWPGRKAGPYEWFHIQDNIAYWEEFDRPKIILARFMNQPTYAWDDQGMYMSNGSSMIAGADQFAVAVLNSAVAWWFLKATSTDLSGGFLQAHNYNQFAIPIPAAVDIQKTIVVSLVDVIRGGISRPEYERLLNGLVYELFFPEDLHAKKIRLFDACAAAGVTEGMDAKTVASTIFKNDHPIYAMLFDLQALDVVRTIEGTV